MSPTPNEKADAAMRAAAEARLVAEEALALAKPNNDMLKDIHSALFTKHPGYEKTVIDRIMAETIAGEQGRAIGQAVISKTLMLGAFGGAIAGVVAIFKAIEKVAK